MLALVDHSLLASKFDAGDSEFFVEAATAAVRTYCGWHIAPSLEVIDGRYQCGERGLIMLNSLRVTAVDSVIVDGRQLETSEFDWDECGFITRRQASWPSDPYALVSFTHGHSECPADVAAVVFEVASKAMSLPAIPAKSFEASGGPFRLSLSGAALGTALSDDHKDRLASYRLQGVA